MNDYAKAFSDYLVSRRVSQNTLDSYQRDVEHYLDFLEEKGCPYPEKAGEELLEEYIQQLQSMNRSAATVTRNLASVRSFYQYLIQLGLASANPAKKMKLEKKDKKLPQILTQYEIDQLLAQPDTKDSCIRVD